MGISFIPFHLFQAICMRFLLPLRCKYFDTMNWIILVVAGLFEVGFTTCLKLSNNFTNWKWSVGFFISITLSFILLNKASQTLPMGTAYAVWTGIGAVGTVLVGIFLFSEPSDWWRIFFIFTLIGSILGLRIVGG